MTHYSIESRDWIFVNGYGFLSFAKTTSKNIGKNISTNFSGKYSQKFLDYAKQSATDTLKATSNRAVLKTAEATGDLIGINTADNITKDWLQNTSKTDLQTEKLTEIINYTTVKSSAQCHK